MRVRSAFFDRAHCRHAHDRVAQPIAAANENSEWFQLLRRQMLREINAAFVTREKEIWARCFPAIVQPKAVLRCTAGLGRDQIVGFGGEGFDSASKPDYVNDFWRYLPFP